MKQQAIVQINGSDLLVDSAWVMQHAERVIALATIAKYMVSRDEFGKFQKGTIETFNHADISANYLYQNGIAELMEAIIQNAGEAFGAGSRLNNTFEAKVKEKRANNHDDN